MRNNAPARMLQIVGLAALLFTVAGCHKPPPTPPPPPPAPAAPPPARPTVTLQASPTFIQQGESSTLSWSSTNATSLTLSTGSAVAPEGSSKVSPTESTTYSITATGPGGTADASVRVSVSAPPPPPQPTATIDEMFRTSVRDAFFDYNKSDIRPDARDALARTAEFLRSYPQIKVNIEGHCDERGSTEYNLGLGDRRAQEVKQFLVSLGVAPERMSSVSMGKERPFCTESDESCWQQNRRGHFVLAAQ